MYSVFREGTGKGAWRLGERRERAQRSLLKRLAAAAVSSGSARLRRTAVGMTPAPHALAPGALVPSAHVSGYVHPLTLAYAAAVSCALNQPEPASYVVELPV